MRLDWTATVFTHSKCEATNYPIDKTKKIHVSIQKVVSGQGNDKSGPLFFPSFFHCQKTSGKSDNCSVPTDDNCRVQKYKNVINATMMTSQKQSVPSAEFRAK